VSNTFRHHLSVAELPTRAQTVIVGAGIVGAAAAYHLAELGVTDVLVLDQGPLFATGGSSSHAPGIIFQTSGSRTMCRIAQETVALYDSLEVDGEKVWFGVGGLEVATTVERMEELKRRQGFAHAFGLDGTELLSPAECAERSPLLDPATVLGGYWIPTDGAGKGVKIMEGLASRATAAGIRFEGGVTVTGFDTSEGRVHAVETSQGSVECERVLLCAGIWGRPIGAMAGVPIPLVAVQHQLVWTDPIPELQGLDFAEQPVVRHQDMSLYFRQRDDHFGIGNYRHEPIVTSQSDLRAPGGAMQPSLMPFTPEDFDLCEAESARMFPALPGRMRPSDPSRSLNGMFSFTPDAGSIVGESATVRGVWVCEAWDKDFQGKESLEAIRDRGPAKRLVPMTFDDPRHVVVGKEPIRHDGRVVSYVTSANYGYSIGRGIVYGYLPAELAIEGTPVEVQYFGDRYAATVAAEPLFDPKGERLRA
jgi:glycine/D-amino acid oxidase-like deaminating enzyme